MRIDAHQHFWRYDPAQYGWIGEDLSPLRRDFLPPDLKREIGGVGIGGVVSVQARQSEAETRWLLELAAENEFIKGVVGWVPLASPDVAEALSRYRGGKLVGVRHVVQDEADDEFILGEDFNRGISALREMDLRYDLLVYERHLPQTIRFVDRHPRQVFVLDHLGKPDVRGGSFENWRAQIRELALRPKVFCKVSGLVTEANWKDWSADGLRPYFDAALEAFGAGRLMFGSDWPVCLVASSYRRWVETVEGWTAGVSEIERARIWGGTAVEAYGLNV